MKSEPVFFLGFFYFSSNTLRPKNASKIFICIIQRVKTGLYIFADYRIIYLGKIIYLLGTDSNSTS